MAMPNKRVDESRWTSQPPDPRPYRRVGEPMWIQFGPREDRTWKHFEATYGEGFEQSVKPCGKKNQR